MVVNLRGDINNDMTQDLIDAINSQENLTIYLNSDGGEVYEMEALLHLITENKDKIRLIGYGRLFSAAFELFFKAPCHKEILPLTVGMAHLSSCPMNIDERGVPKDSYGQMEANELVSLFEQSSSFYKKVGLTSKELKDLKAGKDVFLSSERMKHLWQKNR